MAIKHVIDSSHELDTFLTVESLDEDFTRCFITRGMSQLVITVQRIELEAVLGLISQRKLSFWQKLAFYFIKKRRK